MMSYEIHTYQGGQWKSDSVFDNRELALLEAQKMVDGKRHPSVQVFEEDYDEATNKSTTRRIFKGGGDVESNNRKKPAKAKKGSASRGVADKERAGNGKRGGRAKKRTSLTVPITVLSLLAAVALAALIGLRYFT